MFGLRLSRRCFISSQLPEYINRANQQSLQTFFMVRILHRPSIPSPRNLRCFSKDNDSSQPPDYVASMTAQQLLDEAKTQTETNDPQFPSDSTENENSQKRENLPHLEHSQQKHSYRPKVDPKSTTVFLFPGQASQFVGMGKDLLDVPGVEDLYSQASDILGYDLLDLCLNGPIEKMSQTVYSQPAVMVTSLAAVEKLKQITPWAIKHCIAAAGFSVGEYAALVFSGAITFEQAIHLIKVRAEAMQQASVETPSGMMTIFLTRRTKLNLACHTARRYCAEELGIKKPVCDIANYLYPECKVISGHNEALEFIATHGKEFAIQRSRRLSVSGAFHSPVMAPAKAALEDALKNVEIKTPIIPVHCNVSGKRHRSPALIKQVLLQQLIKPVKWEQIMHIIFSRSENLTFPYTYEVGPGKQLGGLLYKVNKKAYAQYEAVPV